MEWTQGVVLWGRVIRRDPTRLHAFQARAVLYLAAAVRLAEREEDVRSCLGEVSSDLRALRQAGRRDLVVSLLGSFADRIAGHAARRGVESPTVREIHEAAASAHFGAGQ